MKQKVEVSKLIISLTIIENIKNIVFYNKYSFLTLFNFMDNYYIDQDLVYVNQSNI